MYKHDEILIVGDSFAQHRSEPTDWPMALSKLLTGSDAVPNGVGVGGTSWWTARRCIVKSLQNKLPKVLVVCHTDSLRLPLDRDVGLNLGTVVGHDYSLIHKDWFSKDEWTAAQMYYTHLMSTEFHNWARNQWFNELDAITTSIPIVIHLHCFPHETGETSNFIFKHGITSAEVLFHLQAQESPLPNGRDMPGFRNHFSPENNVKIARSLYNTITNFDPANNGTRQYMDLLDQNAK